MAVSIDEVVEMARDLPEDMVGELVDRILMARHGAAEMTSEARAEIHRRIEELESGKVVGVPLEEGFAQVRAYMIS
jgi:putative addiction module component (TIGR02574 family)